MDLQTLIDSGQKFPTIYADPPWPYRKRCGRGAAVKHYPTMPLADIAALPVQQLAADHAQLHLWTTTAFLFDAFVILTAWGFTYQSVFVWAKPQMGLGNYWRVCTEFMLLGTRGDCPAWTIDLPNLLIEKRTTHSTKPESVRRMIEQVSEPPRLELFARKRSPGWTVWGNEVD
jgi:N6-adenosine-specific RNA methylase IME4